MPIALDAVQQTLLVASFIPGPWGTMAMGANIGIALLGGHNREAAMDGAGALPFGRLARLAGKHDDFARISDAVNGLLSHETRVLHGGLSSFQGPTRPFYGTAYEMNLDPSDFGRGRPLHYSRANASLDAALGADPGFAAQMEQLVPGISNDVSNAVSSAGGRATPRGWVWHHATETGVRRPVPLTTDPDTV